MLRADDKETAARRALIRAARDRMRDQGRRALRRVPPRPRRPEQQIREYRAALRDLTRAIERETRDRVFPAIDGLLREAGTRGDDARQDGWSDRLADLFVATRSSIGPVADRAQQNMESLGDTVRGRATDDVKRQVRAVLGVSPDFFDSEQIGETLNAWKRHNGAFITKFTDDQISEVQDAVSRAVRSGRSAKDVRKDLIERFKIGENRAARIARTEISQLNTQITRSRQTELGIEKYTWRTSRDSRVREEHTEREGKKYSWDNPPEGGHPGEPINCFPGSTKIDGTPFCNKLYRRWYTGELTEIVCANGVVLSATPNHPVLTRNGVKPFKLVNSGEYLISTREQGFNVVMNDGESLIPTFGELFTTLSLMDVVHRVTAGGHGQFHGDGTNGEVNIIDINRFLVDVGCSDVVKKLSELGLSYADMKFARRFLSGDCSGSEIIPLTNHASDSVMRFANLTLPLFRAHVTPLECFRFALAPGFDFGRDKVASDYSARNLKFFGNGVLAYSVLVHGYNAVSIEIYRIVRGAVSVVGGSVYASAPEVATDSVFANSDNRGNLSDHEPFAKELLRVVDSRCVDFSGHVYNLETVSGYYTTHSVAVCNCRCEAQADTDSLLDELEKD